MKKSLQEIVRRTCGRGNGNNGNDYLDGGTGNDILNGGAGADTFVFKLGSGQDIIEGSDYQDSLVFGAGISQVNLKASRSVDGLLLNYGSAGDSVLIRGDSYPDVLHFADGSTLATSQLFTLQNGGLGYAVTGTAGGDSRARWRTRAGIINISKAANDEAVHAWRDAA